MNANISFDAYQREIAATREKRMEWFRSARYGLFIHYGLYAQIGRGEWVQVREDIDRDEYAKLADTFAPKEGCCREWAKLAKEAGMKVCAVYDDSSAEYEKEMREVADHYIYDFSELMAL